MKKKAIELQQGKLYTCTVGYEVLIGDKAKKEIVGVAQIPFDSAELVDFESAMSEEALSATKELIDDELKKQAQDGEDLEAAGFKVCFILLQVVGDDLATTHLAFLPDGSTRLYQVSAEDNQEAVFQSMFGTENCPTF